MSVTAPQGFRASGTIAGLKPSGKSDLALVVNDGPLQTVAAVYTANRCRANPVLFSQQATENGIARATILNSGGANCFTGRFGYETTELTARAVAREMHCQDTDVVVCSTGMIGVGDQKWRDTLLAAVPDACGRLSDSAEAAQDAAWAILTTDTVAKTATVRGEGYSIGGMAKGAGMLAPALATMLVVVTTDAVLTHEDADTCLRAATARSFDRLDSDGCMSTNDTVVLMASGASGIAPQAVEFEQQLTALCCDLAEQLLEDAEGAKHSIAITVENAATEDEALDVARAVSRSNLFKTAIFGEDPNWGRIVAQVGTTSAQFDPEDIDVSVNGVQVCRASGPFADPQEVIFDSRRVDVRISLNAGMDSATLLTNDLTFDYVEENSAYST